MQTIADSKCQLLVNFYSDEKTKTSIPKNSKQFLISNEIIDFKNDTINIDSLDSSKAILKIFVSINGKKIESDKEGEQNFHIIKLKELEVKNEYQNLTFNVLNNEINIEIKVKNIFGGSRLMNMKNMFDKRESKEQNKVISTGVRIQDRLNVFNKRGTDFGLAENFNKMIPKKLNLNKEFADKFNRDFGRKKSEEINNNDIKNK